jgi:hypothetical protein
MAYVVIAKWTARPGEEEAVAAAIDAIPRLESRERAFYETW